MGIDLYRVSEWNERRDILVDPKSILPALLNRSWGRNWQLLSLIDPYDDTVFDHHQMDTLLKEFRLLEEYCTSEEERLWLAEAIAFIERSGEADKSLRFVGD
jgi:hypothetical protein